MRFELFLVELPKASTARVQSALAELPKGASTGTILKSMEARTIPTVSIAWSDDKRIVNEVMDTLVELGAGVKLVDHGGLIQKLATFIAEKAGAARYLDDDDDPDSRKYIKLNHGKKNESFGEALTRHTLMYFLQLCAASVLFIWYVALRVGMERTFQTPELWPHVFACALGVLVAYVGSGSVRAFQAGQLSLVQALPQLIVGGALTLASLFFLGTSAEPQSVADGKVKRPPSLPYSGLLSELRRRKLGKEATGRDPGEESEALAEREAREAEEQALSCEKPDPVAALACEGGPAWEDALACLPAPELAPVAKKPRPVRKPVELVRDDAPAPAEPVREAPEAEQAWQLMLPLSTVLTLAAMWLLSLLGVFLQLRRRPVASADGGETPLKAPLAGVHEVVHEAVPEAALEAALEAFIPTVEDHTELRAARQERDGLRVELEQARAALAKAAAEAKPEPVADGAQIATLQRELSLSRGALGANQLAISELKRDLAQATAREAELHEELTQRYIQMSEAFKERDQARSALTQMGQPLAAGRAENDGRERTTGLTRQLPDDADERAYSVNQVQEERVVLGKRRKP